MVKNQCHDQAEQKAVEKRFVLEVKLQKQAVNTGICCLKWLAASQYVSICKITVCGYSGYVRIQRLIY